MKDYKLIIEKQAELIELYIRKPNVHEWDAGMMTWKDKRFKLESELATIQSESIEQKESKGSAEEIKKRLQLILTDLEIGLFDKYEAFDVITALYAHQQPKQESKPNRIYLERFATYFLETEETSIWRAIDKYLGVEPEEEKTPLEMIREVFEPIQLGQSSVVNEAMEMAVKKAGKTKQKPEKEMYPREFVWWISDPDNVIQEDGVYYIFELSEERGHTFDQVYEYWKSKP